MAQGRGLKSVFFLSLNIKMKLILRESFKTLQIGIKPAGYFCKSRNLNQAQNLIRPLQWSLVRLLDLSTRPSRLPCLGLPGRPSSPGSIKASYELPSRLSSSSDSREEGTRNGPVREVGKKPLSVKCLLFRPSTVSATAWPASPVVVKLQDR